MTGQHTPSAFDVLNQAVATNNQSNSQSADTLHGALPQSWYRAEAAAAPPITSELSRPLVWGLLAGLCLAVPAAILQLPRNLPPDPTLLTETLIAERPGDVSLSAHLSADDRLRALIELARLRITVGDVLGARTLLARADVARAPDALFLMAETYDPARLSAWGLKRDVADSLRARALYTAANALGHDDAVARIASLPD